MKPGTLLLVIAEVIGLLKTSAYITADGDFDAAKFNDISSDLALVAGVEGILKKYGVAIPPKVDQIFQIVPLFAGLLK